MNNTANFRTCLKIGRDNEEVTKTQLTNMGFGITDVSDCVNYQSKDIDILVQGFLQDREATFEIKNDAKIGSTGNIFIEDGFDRKTGFCQGWLHKCQADVLVITDSQKQIIYLFNWPLLKQYAQEHGKQVTWWNRTDDCTGHGIVVPVFDTFANGLIRGVLKIPQQNN